MAELKDEIVKLLDEKQAEDIVVLDFKGKNPYLDYFIIATARNARLACALIDTVDDFCNKENVEVRSIDSKGDSGWYLIDLNSIIVHIFLENERKKYDLEGLWKDLIKK